MPTITYQGANRMIVRRSAVLTADPNWSDPAVPISDAEFDESFFGVCPHRGGALGPLKQLGLDVVFLDVNEVEVAGVTFSWETLDIILRSEVNAPSGSTEPARRPFVRKTAEGTLFPCAERLTADVNGSQAQALRLFDIVDGGGTATHYIVIATEIEYR